jgi:hypothetical protein
VKRGGPIQRRTPLKAKTPLRSRTPIRQTKPRSRSAKSWRVRLDNLYSLRIRARDGACLRCGQGPGDPSNRLQCMHIVSRGAHRIRWDDDNGLTGCSRCHRYLTWHPAEKALWEVSLIGEAKYWELHRRAAGVSDDGQRTPPQKIDYEAIEKRLTETPPEPLTGPDGRPIVPPRV